MRTFSLFLFWLFAAALYQITRLVVWLDRIVHFKLPFPGSIDELSKQREWCIKALSDAGALPTNIEVLTYKVSQPDPDLIFRSDAALCSIGYRYENETMELQFVAKFSPMAGTISSRAVYNLQQNHVKEVQFYKEFAGMLKAGTCPQIFYARLHPLTGNMCILMEYVGDHREYSEFEGCPEHLIPSVASRLAEMHATFWNVKDRQVKGIMAIPQVVADFFESYCRIKKWSRSALSVFRRAWEVVNTPQTVIHADARVGNLLFPNAPDKDVVVIDWQGTRMSKAAFDLAYFMALSVPVDTRIKCEQDILLHYHASLLKVGVADYPFEALVDDYNYAVIMTLTMLATPWLTFEGNFDTTNDSAMIFVLGYQYWCDRIGNKAMSLDHWLAAEMAIDVDESRAALAEIVGHFQAQIDQLRDQCCPDPAEAAAKFAAIEQRIKQHGAS